MRDGRRLLSTIAPGTPTPFPSRSSSVMVFWRKETSGMPQKSVSTVCSRTTLAKFSAPSPMICCTQHCTRQESKINRQGVLKLATRVWSGLLETLQGWMALEGLAEVLRPIAADAVMRHVQAGEAHVAWQHPRAASLLPRPPHCSLEKLRTVAVDATPSK